MQLSVHQTWSEFVWQQNVSGYPRAQLQTLLSDVIHYGRGTHEILGAHMQCSSLSLPVLCNCKRNSNSFLICFPTFLFLCH